MPFDQSWISLFVFLAIWDIYWKAVGLWTSARKNQKYWFVAILLINTVGILPIIYLKFFQKKR